MKKNVLLFVIVAICSLLLQLSCSAKNVKFAQVTDVHYKNSSANLLKIIKDINSQSDIDFVVFTGDNIGKANINNLKYFLTDLKKLNKPYYLCLGDRDVSKSNHLDKATYIDTVRRYNRRVPKKPNYTFKKGNIVFVVVDGSKDLLPGLSGVYNNDTIKWVDNQLSRYASSKVILIQHFPIANKPNNEFYYTYNSIEYLKMLSNHNNVLAVIAGHFHKNDEITYNGVCHIVSPKASDGLYKIIEIDCDNDYELFTLVKDAR